MPKTSVWKTRVGTQMLLGKIVDITQIGVERIPCAQVRCQLSEFNIYLKKYFARSLDYWALDRRSLVSLGDTVLIKRIEGADRPKADVSHTVDRIVFRFGNVIDPITGRRVLRDEFSDEVELKKQLVENVVDKPLDDDALLFDERRALQLRSLEAQKNTL